MSINALAATLTDGEVEQVYAQRREEVRVAWALAEVAPLLAAQTATDQELEAYPNGTVVFNGTLENLGNRPELASVEVIEVENCLESHAPHKCQGFPISRNLWPC